MAFVSSDVHLRPRKRVANARYSPLKKVVNEPSRPHLVCMKVMLDSDPRMNNVNCLSISIQRYLFEITFNNLWIQEIAHK